MGCDPLSGGQRQAAGQIADWGNNDLRHLSPLPTTREQWFEPRYASPARHAANAA